MFIQSSFSSFVTDASRVHLCSVIRNNKRGHFKKHYKTNEEKELPPIRRGHSCALLSLSK